jgi:hypothetical protein
MGTLAISAVPVTGVSATGQSGLPATFPAFNALQAGMPRVVFKID